MIELLEIPSPRKLPLVGHGLRFLGGDPVAKMILEVESQPEGVALLLFPRSVSPILSGLVPAGLATDFTHNPLSMRFITLGF